MTSQNGKFLLDTNIIIALFNNEQQVKKHLEVAAEIFISSIVVGELCYGAYNSSRINENLKRAIDFIKKLQILPCDTEIAFQYGVIKHQLKQKGKPIPENDIWIAAIAKKHNLIMVTRDRHYEYIDELKIEHWK